jgi:6-phosphogluconolactonase
VIQVAANAETHAACAADAFVARSRAAVAERGRFTVALAGGHTPRRAYELLARRPRRDEVDWSHVFVFWSDERCVPFADERHNGRNACEILLDHVPVPAGQIYVVECAADPNAAAAAYERTILEVLGADRPRFDLVLLGLGRDGHTASLFPRAPSLAEREHRVVAVSAPAAGDVPRVTFTVPFLLRARSRIFLVTGAAKTEALHAVLHGPRDPQRWPAQLVAEEDGDVLWLVDRAAAGPLAETDPAARRKEASP